MVYRNVAVGVCAGVAAMASSAQAQESRSLDFGVSAKVEHNTNVSRTSKAEAALRGLTLADTVFRPNANVSLRQPLGRQEVFLNGELGYTFYDNNTRLNRETAQVGAGLNTRFGPCGGELVGDYKRGITQFDDPILIDDVDNIQETKTIGVSVSCARQTGFGVNASVKKDWRDNSLSGLKPADSERTSMSAGISYQRPALGVLTVFVNHDETKYPNRLFDNGYELNAVGVTYARQLGARIQGTVTAAYNKVHQDSSIFFPGLSNELETSAYAGSITYRASSRLRFQGSFDRAVTPSSVVGGSYDISQAYRLNGSYDVGSRITFMAGVSRAERDAKGVVVSPLGQLTESTTTSYYGSLRYKQSDRLSFLLNLGREERNSDTPQFEYTNERVGFTTDLSF